MGLDERHYNINTLNKVFAWAAILLLLSLGFLFIADFSRKWKDYQNDFQNTEIEKTRVKLDAENTRLAADPEYKKLQDDLKIAQNKYSSDSCETDLAKAQKIIQSDKNQYEILQQKYRVSKAKWDADKFHYEESLAHDRNDINISRTRYKYSEENTKQLKSQIENLEQSMASASRIIDDCEKDKTALQKKERELTMKEAVLSRKLKKIDPNEMDLINRIANLFRNLPVIDLANPTVKVKQVVLKDIREDLNFFSVPAVDRCTTCHLGIANPDYKDAQQPLRTHPNLELYVSKDSPHGLEEFGCTVCHQGRGRGTDFTSAAHTPSSEEQAEEWKKKYGWKELHHWDKPMYPTQYIEASCFKCHSGQTTIKGAEKLNLGLNLIERAGCYTCHNIDKYKDWPKPGPSLKHIASKTNKDWTFRWVSDPKKFRHSTWMPSYFNQSNTRDPQSRARSEQEIHAIVEYLFGQSENFKTDAMTKAGDAKKGEELVASVGCFGCHVIDKSGVHPRRDRNQLKKEQGPNLTGLGTKSSRTWIYNWLKDPQHYHPGTRMPNLRLTDDEAADIAAYLSGDQNDAFDQKKASPVNEEILNTIILDFLKKSLSQDEASKKLSQMPRDEKLSFAGKKLITQYGCFACHDIKGFENYKPIGTDLTEEGSKSVERFDFGFVPIAHTKEAWIDQKLREPRIFDSKKIKAPDEKLIMPNFNFSSEEAEAITTAVLGFVKDKPGKIKPRTPENIAIEKGQQIIREYNCQGCHIIEGEGGAIRDHVVDWLVKYQGKDANEATAVVNTFSPPNLVGEGKKVQSQWLFEFIHKPETIRPWLKTRMPTYSLNAAHLNALLRYFSSLDKEDFPFTEFVNTNLSKDELISAQKLFSPEYFDCAKCHIVGTKMPAGSPDSWAPNFALAEKRLKPEWLIQWLKNPAVLLPGTKMPTFYDPQNYSTAGPPDILNGNSDEQIRVLRDYVMSISHYPPPPVKTTVPEPAPIAPSENEIVTTPATNSVETKK